MNRSSSSPSVRAPTARPLQKSVWKVPLHDIQIANSPSPSAPGRRVDARFSTLSARQGVRSVPLFQNYSADSSTTAASGRRSFSPALATGVKEGAYESYLRVAPRSSRFFSKRARDAGECQIVSRGRAPGDSGNDVVDVEESVPDRPEPVRSIRIGRPRERRPAVAIRPRPASRPLGVTALRAAPSARKRSSVSSSASSTNPSASGRSCSFR